MDAFVFIPIALYLVFTGLFLQHGLTNLFMETGELIPKRRYLVRFIFASALFCLSLLWVLVAPVLKVSADHIRWSFYVVWLVAPVVGYLYTLTIAEHLAIRFHRVRWITNCSAIQFILTLGMGIYTGITDKPLLFSYDTGSFQSRIDQHLGGAFSPNLVTIMMVIFTSAVVLAATVFFVREMASRRERDVSLIVGVLLTAFAIIVEQTGYLLQWPFIFSLMPVANSIEVMRITYLQTIAAGRGVEQARTQVRRDRLQIQKHLTALSHDVNTPVAALKLTIGQLAAKSADDALTQRLTKELEYVHIVCANLLTLFQLELSSVNSVARAENIDDLLERVATRFSVLAGEMDIELTVKASTHRATLICDSSIMEQAVGNLVYNAILHAENRVTIELAEHDGMVVIDLIDDGQPVPSFTIPSLSDRAYRSFLEQQVGCPGWGLGVAIGHAFAQSHQGSLAITTRADGQTSAKLCLSDINAS